MSCPVAQNLCNENPLHKNIEPVCLCRAPIAQKNMLCFYVTDNPSYKNNKNTEPMICAMGNSYRTKFHVLSSSNYLANTKHNSSQPHPPPPTTTTKTQSITTTTNTTQHNTTKHNNNNKNNNTKPQHNSIKKQ